VKALADGLDAEVPDVREVGIGLDPGPLAGNKLVEVIVVVYLVVIKEVMLLE
jgi:hypothetical protein